jgi:hypothetical protein
MSRSLIFEASYRKALSSLDPATQHSRFCKVGLVRGTCPPETVEISKYRIIIYTMQRICRVGVGGTTSPIATVPISDSLYNAEGRLDGCESKRSSIGTVTKP